MLDSRPIPVVQCSQDGICDSPINGLSRNIVEVTGLPGAGTQCVQPHLLLNNTHSLLRGDHYAVHFLSYWIASHPGPPEVPQLAMLGVL